MDHIRCPIYSKIFGISTFGLMVKPRFCLLIGQDKCVDLLHRLDVYDIPMSKVRVHPSFVTECVIVQPFQMVDDAASFDARLLANDLVVFVGTKIKNKNAVHATLDLT